MNSEKSNRPETDMGKALQIALTLDALRQNQALEDLYFSHQVLASLKRMPKLKPPTKPLKLSEIAPTIPKYEEEEEREEAPEKEEGLMERVRRRFRLKRGRRVPS